MKRRFVTNSKRSTITVRVPRSLHKALNQIAMIQRVSLNSLCIDLLMPWADAARRPWPNDSLIWVKGKLRGETIIRQAFYRDGSWHIPDGSSFLHAADFVVSHWCVLKED